MAKIFTVKVEDNALEYFNQIKYAKPGIEITPRFDSVIINDMLNNLRVFHEIEGMSLRDWIALNSPGTFNRIKVAELLKITVHNDSFDITDIEDSPELMNFKEASKKASNDYKKQFVIIDLNERSNKMTFQLLFIYVRNDRLIDQGNKNLIRLLYTEIAPQLKEGIIELDIESLQLIKNMFSYVLNNPSTDSELLEDFKFLQSTIDKHIIDKTNHLIIENNE